MKETDSSLKERTVALGQSESYPAFSDARYLAGMERLVATVQELSLARSLQAVMTIVRRVARELTGADGATFVLRDGNQCYYADEDAIAPLWKGKRFPMGICISGWTMMNRRPVVIPDIYKDPRIPADAYRPTFVKSLAMVPIRTLNPIGAIGNYWARTRTPTEQEVKLLQSLADTTAVALENVQLITDLESRVAERTVALEAANKELESFSYAVSHDLQAPLRSIDGFSRIILEEYSDRLGEEGQALFERVRGASKRMKVLSDDLLAMSRLTRLEMNFKTVDLSALAGSIMDELRKAQPDRAAEVVIEPGLTAWGDERLLEASLQNLLGNAWKYSSKKQKTQIEFGMEGQTPGGNVYYVKDNGAGFDMQYADTLFTPFQRLHTADEFPGTGVGLATVHRILKRHGGRIWVKAALDQGATFYFTIAKQKPI